MQSPASMSHTLLWLVNGVLPMVSFPLYSIGWAKMCTILWLLLFAVDTRRWQNWTKIWSFGKHIFIKIARVLCHFSWDIYYRIWGSGVLSGQTIANVCYFGLIGSEFRGEITHPAMRLVRSGGNITITNNSEQIPISNWISTILSAFFQFWGDKNEYFNIFFLTSIVQSNCYFIFSRKEFMVEHVPKDIVV